MKKCFIYIRRIVFILLAISLLLFASAIVERKTVAGEWNYSVKVGGFKNEPEDSFDIIGYGSSHMYCTLNPISVYKETGLRSYVLATQQQPVEATYYYIKESLRTQSPDVIIVEALMFTVMEDVVTEGVAHDAIDPFPNGWNKIQMIQALDTVDGKENYYFNFLKYHTRWKSLSEVDYNWDWKEKTDPTHGYVLLTETRVNSMKQVSYDDVEALPITKKHEQAFLDIVKLAKEADVELLLLTAPYKVKDEELGYYKYLYQLAEENGVKVLDLNKEFDSTGIDNETDFYDGGHLNAYGSEKASSYIIDYIKENFDVKPNEVDDAEMWEKDIKYYDSIVWTNKG